MNDCGIFKEPHRFQNGRCKNCGKSREEVKADDRRAKQQYDDARAGEERYWAEIEQKPL